MCSLGGLLIREKETCFVTINLFRIEKCKMFFIKISINKGVKVCIMINARKFHFNASYIGK